MYFTTRVHKLLHLIARASVPVSIHQSFALQAHRLQQTTDERYLQLLQVICALDQA